MEISLASKQKVRKSIVIGNIISIDDFSLLFVLFCSPPFAFFFSHRWGPNRRFAVRLKSSNNQDWEKQDQKVALIQGGKRCIRCLFADPRAPPIYNFPDIASCRGMNEHMYILYNTYEQSAHACNPGFILPSFLP